MSAIFLLSVCLTYWPRKYTTRVDPHVDNSHQVWSWWDHTLPSYSVFVCIRKTATCLSRSTAVSLFSFQWEITRVPTNRLFRCVQVAADPTTQSVTGVTSMIHENYNEAESLNADIAILHLPSALTFNDYVQPICLPSSPIPAGTNCVITGWGKSQSKLS